MSDVFPRRPREPTSQKMQFNLRRCLSIQNEAVNNHAKRPFAAMLVAPDNATVLLSHFSISHVEHAECSLARLAAIHYTQEYLWTCTMYSTWEPCAMCAGTIYWSNIGRLVYAAGEERLKGVTGTDNPDNFTMSMPCRQVLQAGQKDIQVWGPVEGMEEEVISESDKFWRPIREALRSD